MPRINSKKFYTSAIEMHGVSAKGVNWNSKKSQYIRFEIITKLLPSHLSSTTIVDAGCGFGDYYLYLLKNKNLPLKYIGIDSLTDMYSIASKQTGCEIIIANICKDKIPKADYYICSGAMNILNNFETHLFIRNCYENSTKGFIFNVLHGDKDSKTYNYMSTQKIKQIASDLDVNSIKTENEYLKNDITVGFFK